MNWFVHGVSAAALMLWQTFWALALGYTISALLQVFVRQEQMMQYFGRADVRSMSLATFLGAVSSSCSYAASAAAKTAFKKGAALPVALAFMFASTNLVIELTAVLWVLMGWRFVLAEFVGAFVLIAVMWIIVKWTMPETLEKRAREYSLEGGDMKDMMVPQPDAKPLSLNEKIRRRETWVGVADSFYMDVSMIWKEILAGFLIAGFLMVLVPEDWWRALFISQTPSGVRLIGNAIVGPLIAMASFVCSVGNIPLAGWLWSKGISFGGVVSFIYADLIVLPLILIYRKYYGGKAAAYITLVLFLSMVISGIVVDLLFSALGLIPNGRPPSAIEMAHFAWDYNAWLNIPAFMLVTCFLLIHFRKGRKAHCPHCK